MFNDFRTSITLGYEALTKNEDIYKIKQYKINFRDHHWEFLENYDSLEKGLYNARVSLTKLSDSIDEVDFRIAKLKFYIEKDKEKRNFYKEAQLQEREEKRAVKQNKKLEKLAAREEKRLEKINRVCVRKKRKKILIGRAI